MEKELLCILKKYETHPDFLGDTIKDINQVGGMDDTVLHIAARNNSFRIAINSSSENKEKIVKLLNDFKNA